MAELEGEGSQTPRIIKKVHGHGGHHGGSWKVAYADFVTAMMALFIVLWIMAQSQSIRENVAQYFKNPGILPGSKGIMETSGLTGKIPTPGQSLDNQQPPPAPAEFDVEKAKLEEAMKHIEEIIAQLPDLKKLQEQIKLEITEEGLRIELLEKEDSLFFDVGSATPKGNFRQALQVISQELGKLPNRVALEGHTDARPYGSQHYTNWELAVDRANAARRIMLDNGLKASQLSEVRGYADQRLKNPHNPLDYRNRRVSIIVLNKDKSQQPALSYPLEKIDMAPTAPHSLPEPISPAHPPLAPQVGGVLK